MQKATCPVTRLLRHWDVELPAVQGIIKMHENRGYEMFETIIVGNPESCRTEAEIADESGNRVAIVSEGADGWCMEVLGPWLKQPPTNFASLIESAKEVLSHYVNRRGDNVPAGLSVGALSLWLMVKDDGTAMGKKL
jgi:hypothetical protein